MKWTNWWNRFWRRRKQSDRFKVILLFGLAGVFFAGHAVYAGVQVYRMVDSSIEYVLEDTSENGVTDAQISRIREMDFVTMVSRQLETSLVLSAEWGESTISCLEISEAYLNTAYGIQENGTMKTFYLNQAACDQLLESSKGTIEDSAELNQMQIHYSVGEEEKGIARLVVLHHGVPDDKPYAFCRANSVHLLDNSSEIRVQAAGQDLDGLQLTKLIQTGLQLVNEAEIEEHTYRQEAGFLRIRYNSLAAVICLLAVWSLIKYTPRENFDTNLTQRGIAEKNLLTKRSR